MHFNIVAFGGRDKLHLLLACAQFSVTAKCRPICDFFQMKLLIALGASLILFVDNEACSSSKLTKVLSKWKTWVFTYFHHVLQGKGTRRPTDGANYIGTSKEPITQCRGGDGHQWRR